MTAGTAARLVDPYAVLQLDPGAEPEVIRAVYECLLKRYQADMAPGAAERLARLNRAWAVLGDPGTRAAHDRASRATLDTPPRDWPRENGAAAMASRHPGPPRPRTTSSTVDFGRYAGWTLEDLLREDPDYVDWLARAPTGWRFRTEIYALLAARESVARPFAQMRRTGARVGRGIGWSLPWRARAPAGS